MKLGKDEWSYISNVYTTMVNKMNKAEQHRLINKKIADGFYIRSLLTESATFSTDKFLEFLSEQHLPIRPEGPFLVGIFKIDEYKKQMELVHPSQRKMYRFAIGNITEELLSRCCDLIWIAIGG